MAHIAIAYICWLFGGIFGLHHFYLGRDKHALVWWMTLGGLFLGWFRDLWRLPEYLYQANKDPRVRAVFRARQRQHPQPPWKLARFAGQMFVGMLLGYLFRLAIPESVLDSLSVAGTLLKIILPVVGVSLGVYLVCNIGIQKVSYKWCILGAACAVLLLIGSPEISIEASTLISSLFACSHVEWDIEKDPPEGVCNCVKRALVLSVIGCIYLCLWSSVIMYNVKITTSDGMTVPVHEALENFFQSPAWKEFKKSLNTIYESCQRMGWDECYFKLIEHLDPTGEAHAYKVLGLNSKNIEPDEIQSRCRKLSRQHHPDRFKTEEEKIEAQEKFIEIQRACDILNDVRRRRADKNMKSQTTTSSPRSQGRKTEL